MPRTPAEGKFLAAHNQIDVIDVVLVTDTSLASELAAPP